MRCYSAIRILWLSLFSFLITAALVGRLYALAVVHGEEYARQAYSQHSRTLPVESGRGLVLDRNGLPLSDPQSLWAVAAFTPLVEDVPATSGALAPVLGIPEAELTALLAGPAGAVWLKEGITDGQAGAVERLNLPGIGVARVTVPHGPGALAYHLVGYFNEDGGQLGLERAYEPELSGSVRGMLGVFLNGRNEPMGDLAIHTMKPATGKEPYNIETTLDREVQAAVEKVLDSRRMPDGSRLKAAVVVLAPDSGEVLAMASRPEFDYRNMGPSLLAADAPLFNRALAAYPPGSVFKPFVAAMALERGVLTPNQEFSCTGEYRVGNLYFHDAGGVSHGNLTLREAMARSCNITFLQVGHDLLGTEGLRAAAATFGFGQPSGLLGDGRILAEEQAGRVPATLAEGLLQVSFGQGSLTVTPLQLARAYAAIANGGTLPALRLVRKVESPAGEVILRPAAGRAERIISEETAREVGDALLAVTLPGGTGTKAVLNGVTVAGKTGSAEAGSAVHAWFAGYFPAEAPRYVAVVLVENGGSGGGVAAPLFQAIGEAILATEGY